MVYAKKPNKVQDLKDKILQVIYENLINCTRKWWEISSKDQMPEGPLSMFFDRYNNSICTLKNMF